MGERKVGSNRRSLLGNLALNSLRNGATSQHNRNPYHGTVNERLKEIIFETPAITYKGKRTKTG